MTTYPAHRLHFRQPHPRLRLAAAAVVAALVGLGAWLLVDHYTGGAKGPCRRRHSPTRCACTEAARYAVRALNLFYAVGAAGTHFASRTERQAILGVGRARLTAMVAGRVTRPQWITRYGVTVDEATTAAVRGMLAGTATG